jgi:septum formation protein
MARYPKKVDTCLESYSMPNTALILASSSPRRRELLAGLGVTYTVIKPDIDETQHPQEPALDYVRRLSQEKAQAVADQSQHDALILAADTVVILSADTIGITQEGAILGKPRDAHEATTMLQALRNRDHLVCTAFTLLRVGGQRHTQIVQTTVTMRDYSDAEIAEYIASGDPFDKAGSYAIQHEGFHPVAHITGSYTNVMGLPMDEVQQALIHFGVLPAKSV